MSLSNQKGIGQELKKKKSIMFNKGETKSNLYQYLKNQMKQME